MVICKLSIRGGKLMRKGMATGKMEEETRELLDYYNELYQRRTIQT